MITLHCLSSANCYQADVQLSGIFNDPRPIAFTSSGTAYAKCQLGNFILIDLELGFPILTLFDHDFVLMKHMNIKLQRVVVLESHMSLRL